MSDPSLLLRTLRALWLLTASSFVRLMREGLVLRSMIWPGLVICITLTATLVVASALRPGRDVAVDRDTDPELIAQIRAASFEVDLVDEPGPQVQAGRYSFGTDGTTVWLYGTPPAALELESIVRAHLGSGWRPKPRPPPAPREADVRGELACRILALLFVLYGLVFGLGGVARDRDDGTLEAELALPIPRFVGGLARWISATIVLAIFYSASVQLFGALIPIPEHWIVIRHGIAAGSVGVAIGLVVVGTAGVKQGFSGPLAAGITFATALASAGGALGLWWLPIGSLFAGGSGWVPLAVAGLLGLLAAGSYGWRMGGR